MRCRYCGVKFSAAATRPSFRASCPKCAAVVPPIFVERQGDGITGFREIMIGQFASEPSRKLLETQSYHFTIYLDARREILGFDLTDRDEAHLLKWRRDRAPVYYGIRNEGMGYRNHHSVFINGRFSPLPVIAELEACGANLRAEICATLRAGIIAAGEQGV